MLRLLFCPCGWLLLLLLLCIQVLLVIAGGRLVPHSDWAAVLAAIGGAFWLSRSVVI